MSDAMNLHVTMSVTAKTNKEVAQMLMALASDILDDITLDEVLCQHEYSCGEASGKMNITKGEMP